MLGDSHVQALLGKGLGDRVVRTARDGDEQERLPGGVGQPRETPFVGAHQAGAEPDRLDRQRGSAGGRELQQRQRVPCGRLPGGPRQRCRGAQQVPGGAEVEP